MRPLPKLALSLRQPWAWMVVHGGKNLENRKWRTHQRGGFLIHASLGMTPAYYADAVAFARKVAPTLVVPPMESLARGGFIGQANLVDVIPPCCPRVGSNPAVGKLFADAPCTHRWHMAEQYAFVLEDIAPLPFVPFKGALQFFRVPDSALVLLSRAA